MRSPPTSRPRSSRRDQHHRRLQPDGRQVLLDALCGGRADGMPWWQQRPRRPSLSYLEHFPARDPGDQAEMVRRPRLDPRHGAAHLCLGTSPESAGTSESTTASARASKIKQMEQESLRLRKERGRLRADLLGKGAQTAQPGKSSSPHGSAASTGSPPALAGSAGLSRSFDALAGRMGGAEGLAFTSVGGTPAAGLGSWRTGPRQVNGQGSGRRGGGRQGGGKPDAGAQPDPTGHHGL